MKYEGDIGSDDIAKLEKLKNLKLVRFAGLVLRDDGLGDDINEIVGQWPRDEYTAAQIEDVLNHIHVWDEFPKLDEKQCESIANIIFDSWREKLRISEPNYSVSYASELDDYGPTLSIYRNTN